ncbi:MAG: ribosome recycling factor [Rhodospirillales bacterium]|nr:ribosome recycling factor [Rhodospirillales bacterium]
MDGAVDVLHKELAGLRTGRASTSLLEPIVVNAYGAEMPLTQLATVGVPDPRMLTVQVWDRSMVKAVEKAIQESGLGLNPVTEGQLLRVPIPTLTHERRQELTKVAARYAEEARIAVRNVRRHAMDELKKAEKESAISQDEQRDLSRQVQDETDTRIKKIDEALARKESEILQV